MSKERIKELLTQLREEIRETDIDEELEQLLAGLDEDIETAIDDSAGVDAVVDIDDFMDSAKELEASFATEHPTAVRVVREAIDLLVRMGI
jgi:enamine deaminase RidA (YjgF/YER057c/UK114 family)